MKSKWLFPILGVFSLLFISTAWYAYNQDTNHQNREAQSLTTSKKSKTSNEGRGLEDSQAYNTSEKVEDEPSALFNDPAIKQAWGLKKSDAARAWSVTQGSKNVIVAVIDTGIDVNHEDLKANLWKNPGETGLDSHGNSKESNGIDDDGDGFVDDVYGWNFVSGNNNLEDNHGHGTHIAGIIGAEAGNNKGISGISPHVSLMILKYYDPKVPNTDNLKNTVAAIKYAVKMGAHIINYSGGGTDFSQDEHDAIKLAENKGILFVAAAGNERSNSDEHHYYPADYKLKNIVSVTAVDPTTEVLSSSNYGTDTVDIAAPGQNILSCLPRNTYGLMTGTSQATAFVTGAAALIMAHKSLYGQAEDVKKYILATGDTSTSLIAKTRTSRQLNLFKSLTILEGEKMAFSGIDSGSVKDRTIFSNQTTDPNIDSGKSLNQVTGFGKEFMKALGQSPELNKKVHVKKDRIGQKNQQEDQN